MLHEMGGKAVERVVVLVNGQGVETLLGIPRIDWSTGEAQADACLELVMSWKIKEEIVGLVFDTTASNTGLHNGACVRIEKALEKQLAMFACRHHILEIVLSDVFRSVFGQAGGPEVGLFKRFQKEWLAMNQETYSVPDESVFDVQLKQLRSETKEFLSSALSNAKQCPREDYAEFLQLALLFLGGDTPSRTGFRAPGAIHQARWISKGIYCLALKFTSFATSSK